MNFESNQLSLEQQFTHEVFVTKVQNLSHEETKELLIKFHKQTLFKDNYYKQLSRNQRQTAKQNLRENSN